MKPVRVVHISDLHISEHLLRDPESHFKIPHRYGHDVQVFLALDNFLKEIEWDVLAITGDLTRIGNRESFEAARNWLENKVNLGATEIGLQLSTKDSQHYVLVPGNHDRFNGELDQRSLDNYHREFPVIRAASSREMTIRGQRVRFHLFDSTWEKGSFAIGRIDSEELVLRPIDETIVEIALLHHHFIQPPKHDRESETELDNSTEVAAFMLNAGFDGVFFGHTHKSYIGHLNVEKLTSLLPDRRTQGKFWRKLTPKVLLRRFGNDGLVSYKREAARNGQRPTLESHFNYLYLRKKGVEVKGPSKFKNITAFYSHIRELENGGSLNDLLNDSKGRHVLISLAPSACQAEARWKGLHVVEFQKGRAPKWERYQFANTRFERLDDAAHVA